MTVAELLQGLNAEQSKEFVSCLQLDSGLEYDQREPWEAAYTMQVRDLYSSRLLLHCGQFDTLFSSVEEFHRYHCEWLRLKSHIWGRYLRTLAAKYNLLHNTDRTQEETITTRNENEGNSNGSGTNSRNSSGEILHQVSASNQTNFHNKDKDSTTSADNDSSSHKQQYNSESFTEVKNRVRAYGNIGVTTNQQMIKEEREMLQFDLLSKIIDDFKSELCILVY